MRILLYYMISRIFPRDRDFKTGLILEDTTSFLIEDNQTTIAIQ